MKTCNWFLLVVLVLAVMLVGGLSSLASGNVGGMYAVLALPPLSPPGWLFGVVWPVLYLLMGIAACLIYQTPKTKQRDVATALFWVQLAINFVWPIVFFRLEWYWMAVAVIVLLDTLVLLTTIAFFRIKKGAGYLLLPYLIWILFATYLNIMIALLN